MFNPLRAFLAALLLAAACASSPAPAQETAGLRPAAPGIEDNLFVWTDTCNAYVLRDGDAAILFDLGDGGVIDRLGEIGVKKVEWVLFTHHHREQCQGAPKLKAWKPQVAAPEAERALFEKPTDFRKMKPSLGDKYTVYGASYARPPWSRSRSTGRSRPPTRSAGAGARSAASRRAATAPGGCRTSSRREAAGSP